MPTKKRFTDDSFRKEPWFRSLCAALLSCKSEEEMAQFLRDVGTLAELQAWSERFEVAKHLVRGLSYREVARSTGASTTTVTRVARFIENGFGGYRKVLHAHRHHRMHPSSPLPSPQPDAQPPQHDDRAEPAVIPQHTADTPVSVLQKYLHRK